MLPGKRISLNILNIEMKQALERHEAGSASVIPILLRPAFLEGALFEKLQKLPSNGEPVSTWRNRDAAFADIVAGVNKAIAGEEIYRSISIW